MIRSLKRFVRTIVTHHPAVIRKDAAEAYDLWAGSYDDQPDNLMLALDEQMFTKLLGNIDLAGKSIADIGCGTGRHWKKLLAGRPGMLTGYDVSPEMLKKLKVKYPEADTKKIGDNLFSDTNDQSYDIIISTLTIAHIANIDEAIRHWCRLSKPSADMIITDFHPEALALGGSRTFAHGYRKIAINNYVHTIERIQEKFWEHGFLMVRMESRRIDDSVKHYYEKQHALDVFEQFAGIPMIYGMHLKRYNGIT